MQIERLVNLARRGYARLRLSIAGLFALVVGFMALVGAIAVFGGTTEDVTQHNGLAPKDPGDLRFFIDHRSGLLVRGARVASEVGAVPILGVLAVLAAALLWRRGLRVAVAIAPGIALGAAGVGAAIVKNIVGRTRPPVALHLVSENGNSFPSGHATDSAALFVTLTLVLAVFVFHRPIVRGLTVLGGGLATASIGISRLVLGVHWPTDVLAGWALGLAVALAVTMSMAAIARLTPPPEDDSANRVRRVTTRAAHLLAAQRRLDPKHLRAA